jgi:outer membrane protein assembly factor BamB
MTRDPGEGAAFVFDLVEDPDAPLAPAHPGGGHQTPTPDDAEHGADEPPPHGAPGGWRSVTTVAAVLAIAAGTGIAAEGVRDHERIERVRDSVGGVVDVSAPLEETWAWEGAIGAGEYLDGTVLVALGDALVFQSGTDLVALDPATGEGAWTVPLGKDAECGPTDVSPYGSAPDVSVSTVVCLTGDGAGREVVTVAPDGVVSAPRPLTPAEARRYGSPRPGPDGTVLRARRVGPESAVDLGDARCEDTGECTGTVESGRDVELRAEDALTGEVRWTVILPFREADAGQCWNSSWDDPSSDMNFDGSLHPDAFSAWITADLVQLDGCGVSASVTPDGVLLGADREPGMGSVESLGGGRYVWHIWPDQGGAARTVLYSDDGAVVRELPGDVGGPRAADGPGPFTLIGASETGESLRAYDSDGTQLWDVDTDHPDQRHVAEVGRTAVVVTGAMSEVYGIDLATGVERWRWDGSEVGDWVVQSFTDGRAILLVIQRHTGSMQMAALDATTGEVLWQEKDAAADGSAVEQSTALLMAVDGYLLEVSRTGVRGLATERQS